MSSCVFSVPRTSVKVKVFLDLDGTLLDSRRRVYQVFVDLLGDDLLRQPIDFVEYWALKRAGRSNAWLLHHRYGFDAAKVRSFVERWMGVIEAPAYLSIDAPFIWTGSVVEALGRRHELFVLTARQFEPAVHEQLLRFGLLDRFAAVLVTAQTCSKAELVRARAISVTSEDILVGDTGADIEAARALGVCAVGVLSGFRDRATLASYLPDEVFDDTSSFATWLEFRRSLAKRPSSM